MGEAGGPESFGLLRHWERQRGFAVVLRTGYAHCLEDTPSSSRRDRATDDSPRLSETRVWVCGSGGIVLGTSKDYERLALIPDKDHEETIHAILRGQALSADYAEGLRSILLARTAGL